MSKWENGKLVADEPKPAEKTIVGLLAEISEKLSVIAENTAPPDDSDE